MVGGELDVAIGTEPDSLDWMYISATATRDIARNMFENLFSLDEDFEVKPMIAKDYEISEDETTYTVYLREGVKFHNGDTVTASDVVASIERWRKVSSVGNITSEYIEQVKATDEHTVEIKLKEVYHALISDLAAPKSALIVIPEDQTIQQNTKRLRR